jgi:hypothetical protein
VKRVRRNTQPWYDHLPPEVAVFQCRRCLAPLTLPLRRLDDPSLLDVRVQKPFVPEGFFWLVTGENLPENHREMPIDFPGCFAVRLEDVVGLGYHADQSRLSGCCGPSGTGGPNRLCSCGQEVGTERSDCIFPFAVYLDPQAVRAATPNSEPDPTVIQDSS